MTSIERTAYPQFKRLTSARVLHVFFTPSEDEAAWARERTETPEALPALLVDLKCFQRMARFCSREEIRHAVTDHVRHCLGLPPETEADHGAERTMRLHRAQVRKRQGATRDPRRARALAAAAIREAAQVRNHPPDLINVALERIIEASPELPAYSTLDEMAANIRTEVNEAIFAGITDRMGPEGRQQAQGLLDTAGSDGRSMFNRLKKPAQRVTWSRLKAQAEYLDEVDALGDTAYWLEGVAPAKVADITTNVEFGLDVTTGRAVLGAPPDCPDPERNRYLIWVAREHEVPVRETLAETVAAALAVAAGRSTLARSSLDRSRPC